MKRPVSRREDIIKLGGASSVEDALKELVEAIRAIDTSYGTSDFLPGDKSRRLWNALKVADAVLESKAE